MNFMKLLYDNMLFIYCLFLVFLGGIFLGNEINMIKHSAEMSHANKVINNCNYARIVGEK